ncbi:MAG: radical SAM protein, partial [Bilophila sp.]
ILVTGCASEVARDELATLPGVIRVVGQADKPRLLDGSTLLAWLHQTKPVPSEEGFGAEPAPTTVPDPATFPPFHIQGFQRARPVLKVQDGCSHRCAYCIVPLTRGPARSRAPQDCLAEARRLLDAGYREIMLSGINLRQYAMRDQGCADFWELVRLLDRELAPEWDGVARLRISSVDPAQLDARGLDCLAQTRLICPHLHLSLQSGSPAVLQAMHRSHYTPEHLIESVRVVAGYWPRLGLGADILMGFPGETDVHVRETLDVVQALPLTYAHIFPFSIRPGTLAARLPLQVEKSERQRRAAEVRTLVDAKQSAFWQQTLAQGETLLVALDSNDEVPCSHTPQAKGQHGVAACYTPCRLLTPLHAQGHALIPVRPVRLGTTGLLVEPVPV